MQLKNQVCSLELAIKLKELGIKQNSLFYHIKAYNKEFIIYKTETGYYLPNGASFNIDDIKREIYSAFTPAELGEKLPKHISQEKTDKNFLIGYTDEICTHIEKAKTEVNVRAKMLIYLIENNLIKI